MNFITDRAVSSPIYENGDFSELISKVERHLRRIGSVPHFGVVLKGIRTVAEVNMYERGLEPSETDLNIQE